MCKQSFRIYERMIRLMENEIKQPGLYRSELEHDACGIGAIVSINGIKTHQTVSDALSIVENLEHRAGKDAEGKTGDGVGILLQISHKFFKKAVKPLGIELGDERDYGVGMFFFPQDELARNRAKKMSYICKSYLNSFCNIIYPVILTAYKLLADINCCIHIIQWNKFLEFSS